MPEDDKTEPATPKRLQDARNKGQVMKSREVTTSFILLVILIYLSYNIKSIGNAMMSEVSYYLANSYIPNFDAATVSHVIYSIISILMMVVFPFIIVVFFASIVSSLAQVGFLFTLEPLIPDLTRFNPISGFKRFFSFQSVNELFKSIVKFFVISIVVYLTCVKYLKNIFSLQSYGVYYDMIFTLEILYHLFSNVLGVVIVISILDFMIQRYQYHKGLRMTKQEIKDEMKQYEGDAQVKSRIRRMQREIARRKIVKEVKSAHVVITNPTHFAVAVKYDRKKHGAPMVIAKGADSLAFLIKKIAYDNDIPVVENKYVARSIYETCEPGQLIPEGMYQAVAEILAHLYQTNKRFKEIWGLNK